MVGAGEEQIDSKSFREFVWNKRRNEYLRLKYTERYQNEPEPWEAIYTDVNDTAVSELTEKEAEPYDFRANRIFGPYKVKRSERLGEFVKVSE